MLRWAVALLSGCCIPTGERRIEDPAAAWQAAFQSPVPDGVTLQQGQYWQSGHWSGEHAWFFAITAPTAFRDDFVTTRGLTEEPGPDREKLIAMEVLFPLPDWFAPPGLDYRVWKREGMLIFAAGEQLYLHSGAL